MVLPRKTRVCFGSRTINVWPGNSKIGNNARQDIGPRHISLLITSSAARLEKVIADIGVELGPRVHRGYPHILLGRDH
ncbi:hypothetical protein LX15_000922 [Streptoalloteichus tenebrarius]|uniref:Uncharacterized protein n=1 Tax=Streptoalloteichus tenebrarius (strain ATCC 17920 / DSM 40477 / JCM 4838 / CBS 697.72 / NBRC 16177 / NCIMB 11028 / NRRL B-12390 / A12253. 1 / ISP 5477) TaxID=1933 RepID=A0ABT1HNZ7_STRSD|nr:hypothetical protein [Streptoalloteichus tenebrarius]MCP2257237.1 hypothetical protein [Streptoalloteichus tenebrarius]